MRPLLPKPITSAYVSSSTSYFWEPAKPSNYTPPMRKRRSRHSGSSENRVRAGCTFFMRWVINADWRELFSTSVVDPNGTREALPSVIPTIHDADRSGVEMRKIAAAIVLVLLSTQCRAQGADQCDQIRAAIAQHGLGAARKHAAEHHGLSPADLRRIEQSCGIGGRTGRTNKKASRRPR